MKDYSNNSIHPKISVIVPVYNAEKYLPRCIESICNQTYENIEVILVDDGSIDQSKSIAENYQKKDKRVILLTQDNRGSSIARNTGLKHATGNFISFVDSDDWIETDMLSTMLEFALKNELKVVECSSIDSINLNTEQDNRLVKTPIQIIEDKEKTIERIIKYTRFAVWRRLYHIDIIKDRFFIPYILHQDVYYTIDIINEVDKIGFIDKPLYIYNVENMDSVIRGKYSLKKLNSINAGAYVVENTKHYNETIQNCASIYMIQFLIKHYDALFDNVDLDLNFSHRKKIKQTISKYQNTQNFNFYGYAVKWLNFKQYKIFLKLNFNRKRLQVKLIKLLKNVSSQ